MPLSAVDLWLLWYHVALYLLAASKRYSPSHASKYRHHSVEDDYYYNYGYGYYPYPYNDHYSMQFGSQPSLQRREMKYPQQTPSRFGQASRASPFCHPAENSGAAVCA